MATSLTTLLLVVFAITAISVIFGISNLPASDLYIWATNPAQFDGSLVNVILDLAAGVGLITVALGIAFRYDLMVFASFTVTIIGFGKPLIDLYGVLKNSGDGGPILALVIVAPLMLIYLFTAIAWWRGRA